MVRDLRRFVLLLILVVLCQVTGPRFTAEAAAKAQAPHPAAIPLEHVHVTPVEGPSWLQHLGRPLSESSMGQTGLWGPSPVQEQGAAPFNLNMSVQGSLTMSGADLYRLSCRGCHGERGEGAPPEINSIIAPVQSTSMELVLARMKKSGAPVSTTVAKQLAAQSKAALLHRIHNGGQNMPPFPQLTPPEVQALVEYLDLLVGVPGAESKQTTLEIPIPHVGEDLVKATCHVCHAATGPNPTPDEMLQGAIPPLAVLPKRLDVQQFVQKVTIGRPIVMGNLDLRYRGRMPVFYYIKPDEAAAAYVYLEQYPPAAVSGLQNPARPAHQGRLAMGH